MSAPGSQQVRWWDLREWMEPHLADVGDWPMVATQAWLDLDDTDPRKLAAVLDAAQHWALRVETCQAAECEASHAVSGAADWSGIASQFLGRAMFYAERPWLKRITA
jgi:hypothetical protein